MEDENYDVEEPPQQPGTRRPLGELGASLVEYALLLALICLVCLAAVSALGGNNKAGLTHSQSCIAAATAGANPHC